MMKNDEIADGVKFIRGLDEFDIDDLYNLLGIAQCEQRMLLRNLARAKLEGRVIEIVSHLIEQIPTYDEDKEF